MSLLRGRRMSCLALVLACVAVLLAAGAVALVVLLLVPSSDGQGGVAAVTEYGSVGSINNLTRSSDDGDGLDAPGSGDVQTPIDSDVPSSVGPSASSSLRSLPPLPDGAVTPVVTPAGMTSDGYTSGDLTTPDNAPAYSATVQTATVGAGWGVVYQFQCDAGAEDSFRRSHPGEAPFTVLLGGHRIIHGTTYSGSGYVRVGGAGGRTYQVTIEGPCSYELDYVSS